MMNRQFYDKDSGMRLSVILISSLKLHVFPLSDVNT